MKKIQSRQRFEACFCSRDDTRGSPSSEIATSIATSNVPNRDSASN